MTVGAMDLPPEGMLLGGVSLAGDPASGTVTTDGLSLLFTSSGITVQTQHPVTERLLPWTGLDTATCGGEATLPDGRTVALLVLTSGTESIQFHLPREAVSPGQVAYLNQALPLWIAKYRQVPTQGGTPSPAVTPAAAAAGAGAAATAGAGSAAGAAAAPTDAASVAGAAAPARPPAPPAPAPPPPAPPAPAPPALAPPAPAPPAPAAAPPAAAPPAGPQPPADQSWGYDAGMPGELAARKPPKTSRKQRKAEAATAAALAAMAPAEAGYGLSGTDTPVAPLSPLSPEPPAKSGNSVNRRTIALLAVLLVVVIGAGIILVVKRHNGTTSTTATTVTTPPGGADKLLAEGINLHQGDLPTGWTRAQGTTPSATSPTTPAARGAEAQAVSTFAACLGMPVATIDQLFGSATQVDVTATASSPVFQSPADPNIQMQSNTNVVKTSADTVTDTVPFTKSNFVPCFQAFESAAAAASTPGAIAQVVPVTLAAPAGVTSYGYLTTITVPNQGTRVVGDAFIAGGRIEATLSPSTNGPAVPSAAFSQAYGAMVTRVAAAKGR